MSFLKHYPSDDELYQYDLSRVSWGGTRSIKADLKRANLMRANLSEADLAGTNLSGANLMKANLGGANLSGAWLRDANLKNITWQTRFTRVGYPTTLPDGTEWTRDTDITRFTDPNHLDFWEPTGGESDR
jgi:hypothetical protein